MKIGRFIIRAQAEDKEDVKGITKRLHCYAERPVERLIRKVGAMVVNNEFDRDKLYWEMMASGMLYKNKNGKICVRQSWFRNKRKEIAITWYY